MLFFRSEFIKLIRKSFQRKMNKNFLIYGATGFVGEAMARYSVQQGLKPILAARNKEKLEILAGELNLEFKAFTLEELQINNSLIKGAVAVLNCAGPFVHTFKPLIESCIKNKIHYLDISGEIPVFESIVKYDKLAIENNIMLLPGAGFDVTPTDCLSLYLKEKLPTGNRLTLGFCTNGPAGLPPGTAKTGIELIPYGNRIRENGKLVKPPKGLRTKMIDFGNGLQKSTLLLWGDVFTAYYSTGIPNIEVYAAFSDDVNKQMSFAERYRSILSIPFILKILKKNIKGGSTEEERNKTSMSVWGELKDKDGNVVQARLHGPEGGVIWTSQCALAIVKRILSGDIKPGYQTPAKAYGSELVMECEGVERIDIN